MTAIAGYAAMRPTVARGSVLAADLLKANPKVLSKLTCDDEVPIGVDGATFWCDATFLAGPPRRLHFSLARTGAIKQIGQQLSEAPATPKINKSDPWE
ncbi:MAG: hypothetical protein QM831_41245 [Kofleriaceae bacterium]